MIKLDLIAPCAVVAAMLALSLATPDIAATSPDRSAATATNGPSLSTFKRKAQTMFRAVSSAYTGDAGAELIVYATTSQDRAIDQTTDVVPRSDDLHTLQMRQIAEQIATGQTRELDATKK
ncbi:hypothetical protein [Paraburkholderia solisilvae]|uniref:Uncharacterized protein n=1 Tax=Paraburkholderia solisilvae TaxID=624376 RepID=A0A6J5E446_9BURK|nr:hypothetical protein [Paraburkholderia solisilvae]CAB3760056.1 hypothetical protein LMG29739_03310 [Paraburkholderia solisilvae]